MLYNQQQAVVQLSQVPDQKTKTNEPFNPNIAFVQLVFPLILWIFVFLFKVSESQEVHSENLALSTHSCYLAKR